MLYKNVSDSSLGGIIKDVDVKTGTVTGYFSVFGNKDSDGDVIVPGAFKRTLAYQAKRLKHLNQHNPLMPLSGTRNGNLTLKEDSKGLYFESKISETSYGKDVILLYQDGVLDEHSIGYEVADSEQRKDYKELRELKLWEGSTVTWGANELAGTESVKSLNKEQTLIKMHSVLKALRNGKYEQEEVFDTLEIYFKQLEQHILNLSSPLTEEVPGSLVKSRSDLDEGLLLIALETQLLTA